LGASFPTEFCDEEKWVQKNMKKKLKSFLHRSLRITIVIKGIDGILDTVAGLILFILGSDGIAKMELKRADVKITNEAWHPK